MNIYNNPVFYANYKNKSIALQDIVSNSLNQSGQCWPLFTGQTALPLTLKQTAPFWDYAFPYSEYTQSKAEDEFKPCQRRRTRTAFSYYQLQLLESAFIKVQYPDLPAQEYLSNVTNLPKSKIQIWFKNRRAKYRRTLKSKSTISKEINNYVN